MFNHKNSHNSDDSRGGGQSLDFLMVSEALMKAILCLLSSIIEDFGRMIITRLCAIIHPFFDLARMITRHLNVHLICSTVTA